MMNKTFKAMVIDMIPVVLGVLIALFINNWKENLDDKKFVNHVMGSIVIEATENKVELEKVMVEHKILLDTIGKYMENENVSIGNLIGKVNGIRGVSIKNASWKAMLNDNLRLINYKLISELSDIDEGKEAMKVSLTKMMDFIYAGIESTDYNKKIIFRMIIGDLAYLEEQLLDAHNEFLKLTKIN